MRIYLGWTDWVPGRVSDRMTHRHSLIQRTGAKSIVKSPLLCRAPDFVVFCYLRITIAVDIVKWEFVTPLPIKQRHWHKSLFHKLHTKRFLTFTDWSSNVNSLPVLCIRLARLVFLNTQKCSNTTGQLHKITKTSPVTELINFVLYKRHLPCLFSRNFWRKKETMLQWAWIFLRTKKKV